jgi:tricorn protease
MSLAKTCLSTLALLVCLLPAADLARGIPATGARHPAPSPDGSQLAFGWRGDIWVVPTEGGTARRLTDHVAHDAYPRWSPDGTEIAFSSDRHGNHDIFVVAVAGGIPERLTVHSDGDRLYDWSPDGRRLYFGSQRESRHNLVYAVSRDGDRPVRVSGDVALNATVSPDGRWIAYVRGFTNWWRKHYRGPASREIWVRALDGGERTAARVTWWSPGRGTTTARNGVPTAGRSSSRASARTAWQTSTARICASMAGACNPTGHR